MRLNEALGVGMLVVTGLLAVFAWLTWRVYVKIAGFMAVNNQILEKTNVISEAAVEEAQRSRLSEFQPLILPRFTHGPARGESRDETGRYKYTTFVVTLE